MCNNSSGLTISLLDTDQIIIAPPQNYSKTLPLPPPLWKFQLSFIHFLKYFGFTEPPTPQEIPILSVGEYGYFLELHNAR